MRSNGRTEVLLTVAVLAALTLASGALVARTAAAASESYDAGLDALDREEWRQAVRAFDAVIDEGGDRADAALYWKAYALGKQGRFDRALLSLEQLESRFPRSRWLEEAAALEVELRQRADPTTTPDDEERGELKILAIQGLMASDPDKAAPMLKKLVLSDESRQVREQALFVLIQSGTPEAFEVTAEIARNASDPALQEMAIQNLGVLGDERAVRLLSEVYRETGDPEMRSRILSAFMIAGHEEPIFAAARNESSPDLRREAIHLLGVMNATSELAEMYERETSIELRAEILNAFMVAGDERRVLDAATDESAPELREQAVQLLGVMGANNELNGLYEREGSPAVKAAILQALMIGGDTTSVLDAARTEASPELREQAISLLGVMDAADALWELYEVESSPTLRLSIVQSLSIAGDVEHLTEIARGDGAREIRVAAIEGLGIGGRRAAAKLPELYESQSDPELRIAVLHALMIQGNVRGLIDIARKETDRELKTEAVRLLSVMGSEEATEFMMELLDE
jgi:thioredoxin-like negative regulator of GroEL